AVVLARGGLVGTMLLLLVAGSCFGHPFFHASAITADRLLLLILIAQYVVYRRWGWTDSKPLAKVDLLVAALLLVITASTLTHDFRIDGWWPVAMLIIGYLMPATIYWIAREARWTERAAWWTLASLAVF